MTAGGTEKTCTGKLKPKREALPEQRVPFMQRLNGPLSCESTSSEREDNRGVFRSFPMKRKFVTYNPKVKATARMLRKQSTLAEILLWDQLKGRKMLGCDFLRQKPIHNYMVDLFSPRLMLAVEIDGASHLDKEEEDERRQKELESRVIRFLRFQGDEVKKDLGAVVDMIKQWILERREDEA